MNDVPQQAVVLRYRDGVALRGSLRAEFSPRTNEVEIEDESGTTHTIRLDQLKAVFFLKDARQRSADMSLGETVSLPDSALARVEFFDGEIMRGRVRGYSLADAGFFLYPTSADSNHRKVFVVAAALTTLAIEG